MSDVTSIELSDGEVRAWIEQGATVCMKAIDPYGDPVEMTAKEVKQLADALLVFYEVIRD